MAVLEFIYVEVLNLRLPLIMAFEQYSVLMIFT